MQLVQVERHTFRLPRRRRQAHKGDFGRVYILAGSVGCTGAPVFAANAAVRTGSGLVFLGVPEDIWSVVAVKCNEAMPHPLPQDADAVLERAAACDTVLIGPGLGRGQPVEELVRQLTARLQIPLVLDADGLNALVGHLELLDGRAAPTVITPHEGEFARLTGCGILRQTVLPWRWTLRKSMAAPWCSRDITLSPPRRTAGFGSIPRATPAWPKGGAAMCLRV